MFQLERPRNEFVRSYEPGSWERKSLKTQLDRMAELKIEIPCFIGGREVFTQEKRKVVMPHDHRHVLAEFHVSGPSELEKAAQAALKAKGAWEAMDWSDRAAVFLKAADLLAGPYRDILNAATML